MENKETMEKKKKAAQKLTMRVLLAIDLDRHRLCGLWPDHEGH